MDRRFVRRPKAREDIIGHTRYINRENPDAAWRFLLAIEEFFEILKKQPEIGPVYRTSNSRLEGLRMFPLRRFKEYVIFYRLTETTVEVVRVLHGKRDIKGVLESEEE